MKNIVFSLLLLLLMMASCNGDRFKIDGNLVNLDGAAVHIVYCADSVVVDQWVDVDKKGHFTFQGVSAQPVVVSLSDQRGDLLAQLVAMNGDHLKVAGDAGKAMGVNVKGNRLNEEWQLFRDEHRAFYADPNPSRLDAAIEKYVREHPADVLSTVLLVTDYSDFSDYEKLDKLLRGIQEQARPESLAQPIDGKQSARKRALLPRLTSLTLFKHGGKFEEIKLIDKVSVLSMWANPQKDRKALIDKLQTLDKGIRIIDILTESDSLRWHQTIANDPKDWQHCWAPGGPLEQGIQMLGITSLPWYAVTDSTGLVVYSGPSCDVASKKVSDLIH